MFSVVRVEISHDDFLYVCTCFASFFKRRGNVSKIWDTQSEVGGTWNSLSLDCDAPRVLFFKLTFSWSRNGNASEKSYFDDP